MPTTLARISRKTRRMYKLTETTPGGLVITGNKPLPQAGSGACKLCSCKKFVPDARFQLNMGEGHQFVACGNCGHDVRQHA